MTRIQRVHAVEHPQKSRLSAAGGTDERRDTTVAKRQVHVLQRVGLAIVEIEMPPPELDRMRGRARRGGRGTDTGRGRAGAHRRPPGFSAETTKRAMMLRMRIVRVINSAPDHASCCQFLYGLRANWKMTTGRLAIGWPRLLLQNWLLSAVNRSGAVSPLMRATASNSPVTMPLRAPGEMMLVIVRTGYAHT